jgi:hypothetical protein
VPVIPATTEAEVRGLWYEANPGKVTGKLYIKNKHRSKKNEEVPKHLPSKYEALRSIPVLKKK